MQTFLVERTVPPAVDRGDPARWIASAAGRWTDVPPDHSRGGRSAHILRSRGHNMFIDGACGALTHFQAALQPAGLRALGALR